MRQDMERKELEYYLNLRYPVTVHPDPEGGFVAEIEELHGCMTQAETLDEVFQAIEDARQLWIKTAYDEGQDIPLPRDMEHAFPRVKLSGSKGQGGIEMTFEDILKLWTVINALSEEKAKLALFGATLQKLGQQGTTLSDFDEVLEVIKSRKKGGDIRF